MQEIPAFLKLKGSLNNGRNPDMSYYNLSKEMRDKLRKEIEKNIRSDIETGDHGFVLQYSSDDDTYIRKIVYLFLGKLFKDYPDFRRDLIALLRNLLMSGDEKVRQTAVNTLGEIGKYSFDDVPELFEFAFEDKHHSVLNAVTGALKQAGEKNPEAVIGFIKKHLHHTDSVIRAKILHGLELRGRKHPEEILPVLAECRNDPDKTVTKMVIHVIGQISYKEGCLDKVVDSLKDWENSEFVKEAADEIIDVHKRYHKFASLPVEKVRDLLNSKLPKSLLK